MDVRLVFNSVTNALWPAEPAVAVEYRAIVTFMVRS